MSTVVNLRDFPPRIALGPNGRFSKGRHLPPDVVRVDRPSRWGNPYKIGANAVMHGVQIVLTREWAINLYEKYAVERLRREPTWLDPLRGKRLACWCAPERCHADVLAALIAETASA